MIGRHIAALGLLAVRVTLAAAITVIATLVASANDPKPMRGVALIIGNSDYEHLTRLTNPKHDAGAIEKLFGELGFETYDATDADLKKLRRTIDRFIEDAEGVDVALVYYAGHGVEAGGENYLVPVDADVSSLDDAAGKLVPLSEIMGRLREVAPLSFVLLDACRDNPFPPGSTLRPAAGAEPLAVAASGLGETRTMKKIGQAGDKAKPATTNDSLGTLIGFAAEPGQRALDGEPGGNSPYAAAVLRHVPAMAGEEISTVMRMVAEEVYLKTAGRQRPWVNENLRRLVYLGSTPPEVEGAQGDILRERRQLLINIAALPDPERRKIEAVARDGGVTMDSVYGMFRALGDEAPKDPEQLAKLLQEQVAKIKELESERAAIKASDPEIIRLAALADQATSEGAVETALKLHEEAKARVQEISTTIDTAEADIKARRLEFADVYARSAKANFSAFKYEQAAKDYEEAYNQVERWDDFMAWSYRGNQAVALMESGWKGGATDSLRKSADLARDILALSEKLDDRANWALSQTFLGNTLMTLGQRVNDQQTIAGAIKAYEAALTVYTQADYPIERRDVLQNLAGAVKQVAQRYEPAKAKVELSKSIALFDELLKNVDRTFDPRAWASIVISKAMAMNDLGRLAHDAPMLRDTISLLSDALAAYATGSDTNKADALCPLAVAWSDLGVTTKDKTALDTAEEKFAGCIALIDKAVSPVAYGDRITSRALNLHNLYLQTDDPAWLARAIPLMREARDMLDPVALPVEWRAATTSLGGALLDLGRARKDAKPLGEAVELFATAQKYFDPAKEPDEWADNLSRLADVRRNIGELTPSLATFNLMLDEHEQALGAVTADRFPKVVADIRQRISWIATATSRLGDKLPDIQALSLLKRGADILDRPTPDGALAYVRSEFGRRMYGMAIKTSTASGLKAAIASYRGSLVPEAKNPDFDSWRVTQSNLGLALVELARIDKNDQFLAEAIGPIREAILSATDDNQAASDRKRLATTYDKLAADYDPAKLRLAADAWRDVIAHFDKDTKPGDRYSALESLAINQANLAAFSPEDAAQAGPQAIAIYRQAMALMPKSDNPEDRERTSRNLALALYQEGERVRDRTLLEEAAGIYRDLSRQDRATSVQRDADRLSRSGSLVAIARIANDKPAYAAAAASYRVIFGDNPSTLPPDASWVHLSAYAEMLREASYLEDDVAGMRRAIGVLKAVLDLPDERLPRDQIDRVRLELANTQLYAGDLDNDEQALTGAIGQFAEIAGTEAMLSSPEYTTWLNERLALAHLILGEIADRPDNWRQGVAYMRTVYGASAGSTDKATIARNSGNLAFGIARAVRAGVLAPGDIAEALALAETAVAAASTATDELPYAQWSLCTAQIEDGRIRGDRKAIESALELCNVSLEATKAKARRAATERSLKTITYAEELLKKM
jgi:uncharacterized caspase-like protein